MPNDLEGSTSSENSGSNPDDDTLGSSIGSSEEWAPVVERLAEFASPEKKIDPLLTPPKETEAALLLNALKSTKPETLSFEDLEEFLQLTKRFKAAAARVLRPTKCIDSSDVYFLSAAGAVPVSIGNQKNLTGFPGVDENQGKWTVRDRTNSPLKRTVYSTLEEALITTTASLKARGYRIEDGVINEDEEEEEISTATNPK